MPYVSATLTEAEFEERLAYKEARRLLLPSQQVRFKQGEETHPLGLYKPAWSSVGRCLSHMPPSHGRDDDVD